MGPLINAAARDRCERYVALAEEHGGKVAFGGGRPAGFDEGYYFEPTVLDLPDNANPAAQDEIFGPVLAVIGYDDVDDAVRIANDSPYGLSGQVYGADVPRRRRSPGGCAPARSTSTRRSSAPTRPAAATSRAASAASGARGHPRLPGGQAHGDRRAEVTDAAEPRLAHLGRRPHPRAADLWVDRVAAKDRDRAPHMETRRRRRLLGLRRQAHARARASARSSASRRRSSAPSRCRTPRCDPVATTRRPASTTWTRPASSPRSASRRSPGSAASCSWRPSDREFGLECLKVYNDWLIEEWCGAAPGRYIPLMLIPMWDPAAAAEEMERMADQGVTAFAFSENPAPLGLPTIHDKDGYWDPVMADGQRARDGRVDARRLVVAGAVDRPGLAVHGQPHLGGDPHVGGDALVAVQRHVPAVPQPQDRPVGGRDRLDPVLPRAGRAGARQAAPLGHEGPDVHGPRRHRRRPRRRSTSGRPSATTSSAASSRTTTASPASTRSARTT